MSLPRIFLAQISRRFLSTLPKTQSGQCTPLLLFVFLLLRAEDVPDLLVEHILASIYPLPLSFLINCMTVTLPFLPSLFTGFALFFPTGVSPQNIQLFSAFLFAYGSNQTSVPSFTELRGNQNSVLFKLQKRHPQQST